MENYASLSTLSLENLGVALNNLNSTTLLNGQVNNLYNSLIEMLSSIDLDENTTLENLANAIKIENSSININWQNELKAITPLFNQLMSVLDTFNENTITNSNFLKQLGANLQSIKTSNLNNLTSLIKIDDLVVEMLNIASTFLEDGDAKTILLDLKETIENYNPKSEINYTVEFEHIANMIAELNNDTIELTSLCSVLDIVINGSSSLEASKILDKAIFKTILKHLPNANDFAEEEIKNILNNAQEKATAYNDGSLNITDYKKELNVIIDIVDLIDAIQLLDINSPTINSTVSTVSSLVENIQANSLIFTNIKEEAVNLIISKVEEEITDADVLKALETAKVDIHNINPTILDLYDDLMVLSEEFDSLNYTIQDLANDNTLVEINTKLKIVINLDSFSKLTTDAIYNIILDKVNNLVQSINASAIPYYGTQIANYQTSINTLIEGKQLELQSKTEADILNDYYLTSLREIKTALDPLIAIINLIGNI